MFTEMKTLTVDIQRQAFCQWQAQKRTETGCNSIFIWLSLVLLMAPVLCSVK